VLPSGVAQSGLKGLPKCGALLQGAENGGAYACAKGMDGEKNYYSPPRTALPFCVSYVYNYYTSCGPLLLSSLPLLPPAASLSPPHTNERLYSTPSLL
jgi:hypothetical protein